MNRNDAGRRSRPGGAGARPGARRAGRGNSGGHASGLRAPEPDIRRGDVALAERSVIVRTNAAAGAFAGTAHNLAALARLGLPVPRVLPADLTEGCFPFGWMILEKIPGRKTGGHAPSHHAICGMVLFTPAPHPLPPHHLHTAPPRLPPPASSPGRQERRQNPAYVGGIEGKNPQVHMEPARLEYVHVGPADPEKGQS